MIKRNSWILTTHSSQHAPNILVAFALTFVSVVSVRNSCWAQWASFDFICEDKLSSLIKRAKGDTWWTHTVRTCGDKQLEILVRKDCRTSRKKKNSTHSNTLYQSDLNIYCYISTRIIFISKYSSPYRKFKWQIYTPGLPHWSIKLCLYV